MSAAAKALDLLLETIGSKEQSAMALNLSAQLAAVARAAMARRKAEYYVKAERSSTSQSGLWQAESIEAAVHSELNAALDALEAAAEGD